MKKFLLFTVTVGLLLTPAFAFDISTFKYFKEVGREPSVQEDLVAAVLDAEVYAVAGNNYEDIRVIDDAGTEIPFLLEKAVRIESKTISKTAPSSVKSLEEKAGNKIEITVTLDKDAPSASRIEFQTPLKDFERRVTVWGGARDHAEKLVGDAVIFDYSRYMDVRETKVDLPDNDYRSFRVVIDDVTDEQASSLREMTRTFVKDEEVQTVDKTTVEKRAFRIDRLFLVTRKAVEKKRTDLKQDYLVSRAAIDEKESGDDETVIAIEANREPLTSLSLVTESRNFSRQIEVEVARMEGVQKKWRRIEKGTVTKIQFKGYERENLTISFPEQRAEEYRVKILNNDSPPLQIKGITARGNVYQAVFLAGAGRDYAVLYGADNAAKPKYDTKTVLEPLRKTSEPVSVTLGPQTDNAEFKGAGWGLARFFNSKIFFVAVVAVVIAVLAIGLVRAGKAAGEMGGS